MARGGAAANRQAGRGTRSEIVEIDRIAVDRGVVLRRHVARRHHRLGQHATARFDEGQCLAAGDGDDLRFEDIQRLGGGQQRPAEGEAIIAELGHPLLPRPGNARR